MPAPKVNGSRRAKQSQSRHDSESSDEEPSTQRSTQNKQCPNISGDIREQLVNNCVYYLLIVNQKGYPIKKTDIVKNVLKEHPRAFDMVISKAADKLKKVFGFNFVQHKKGSYVLINRLDFALPETDRKIPFWSDTECAHHGLLMIILVVIFMNGNMIPEAQLWEFLKKLGIDVESERPHTMFGNVKKLICQEFVRKAYLEHKLIPGSEPPVYEFRFGHRAILETNKNDMLELVCQLYENMKPENWATQFQDANDETLQ